MKLNVMQALMVVDFLFKNKFINKFSYHPVTFGEFFNEEHKEIRVIDKYGSAGKLWNHLGAIVVSGYSESEIGAKKFKLQEIEVEMANRNIAAIIEAYKDPIPKRVKIYYPKDGTFSVGSIPIVGTESGDDISVLVQNWCMNNDFDPYEIGWKVIP